MAKRSKVLKLTARWISSLHGLESRSGHVTRGYAVVFARDFGFLYYLNLASDDTRKSIHPNSYFCIQRFPAPDIT